MIKGTIFWEPSYQRSDLENSPSRSKMDLPTELQLRCQSVIYIFKAGSTLELPFQAVATACCYLHHFYMMYPYDEKERHNVRNACLFLASKVEECRTQIRDIVRVQFYLRNLKPPVRQTKEFNTLCKRATQTESLLLKAIDFCFQINHPYFFIFPAINFMLRFDGMMLGNEKTQKAVVEELARISWWFVNDSYKSPLCLFHPPQQIALAAVELAVRYHNVLCEFELKSKSCEIFFPERWWEIFGQEVPRRMVDSICREILSFAPLNPLQLLKEGKKDFAFSLRELEFRNSFFPENCRLRKKKKTLIKNLDLNLNENKIPPVKRKIENKKIMEHSFKNFKDENVQQNQNRGQNEIESQNRVKKFEANATIQSAIVPPLVKNRFTGNNNFGFIQNANRNLPRNDFHNVVAHRPLAFPFNGPRQRFTRNNGFVTPRALFSNRMPFASQRQENLHSNGLYSSSKPSTIRRK